MRHDGSLPAKKFRFLPMRHKLHDAVYELSSRLCRSNSTHQLQTVDLLLLLLLLLLLPPPPPPLEAAFARATSFSPTHMLVVNEAVPGIHTTSPSVAVQSAHPLANGTATTAHMPRRFRRILRPRGKATAAKA
jgi:hypothetical protein